MWQHLKCYHALHSRPSVWMSPVMRLSDKTRVSARPSQPPRRMKASRNTAVLVPPVTTSPFVSSSLSLSLSAICPS